MTRVRRVILPGAKATGIEEGITGSSEGFHRSESATLKIEEEGRFRKLAERYQLEYIEMDQFYIDQEQFRSIPADVM